MLLPDKWSNKGNLQIGALDSLYHFFYFPLYIKQCQSTLTNKSNLMYLKLGPLIRLNHFFYFSLDIKQCL